MAASDWLKRQAAAPRTQALYDQMLVSGVNFLTLLFIGRRFEYREFGVFMLAYLSIVAMSTLHAALIIRPFNLIGATRSAAANLGHLRALLRLHGWLWLPASVLFLSLLGWQFFPDPRLMLAASVYLCAFLMQELLRRYWYTAGNIKLAFANDVISYGMQLPLLALWAQQPSFDGATAFYVMASTSFAALLHGWYFLRGGDHEYISARALLAKHWAVGSWLLAATISSYGVIELYPYFLASLGPAAVATFAAGRNIMNALNVIAQTVNSYLPIRSKQVLQRHGVAGLSSQLKRTSGGVVLVTGGFCAVVAYLSTDLLQWVYGKPFEDAEYVLPLLAITAFATTLFPVISAGILALDKAPVIFFSNIAAIVFNVSIGWWLIQRYGVTGAAAAASICVTLVLVIQSWRLLRELRQLSNPEASVKPCLP